MKKKAPRSSRLVIGEVSRIEKILCKIPGLEKHVKGIGELILMDIGVIRLGKQGLEVSFASDANTTIIEAVTKELSARYALKINIPHYQAADATCHSEQEGERAYLKDLEAFFMKKLCHEAMAEIIFREYESDITH